MFISSPKISRNQVEDIIREMVAARLSAVEFKIEESKKVLDGISLEELTNFSVPLTANQSEEQRHDGVLLGYKDGKLVEEKELNGGEF